MQVGLYGKLMASNGEILKAMEDRTSCTILAPNTDDAGFNIMIKSWNPVFLGLGLRAVCAVFDHDETKAVFERPPVPPKVERQAGMVEEAQYGSLEIFGASVRLCIRPSAMSCSKTISV